ncbi:diguanylate cyclase with GAF sensor [Ferrimonas balearica DSM 9799]|uniref:Diguanylate cyclase with GAF sensor n=1 Tax=Ferrimonas balearica (strain DSM 9799 / CCM 4581 / KCTC 23876 / PAT) TaxID=550540 RepID=E1SQ87_FERBD|nr:sensor domain-containing diguanylate cyclase [Ferrimonas balearica]ADN77858.1 diguanylate cyclase with GAF sensor [Ferrimonas balearica DSM 9799]MBY5982204.1 sensor domain-containing diguanylate cyclase [Ferrimonas balearica]
MIVPAWPLDEAQRLASLRGLHLLDTPIEERFDRLTRLAQRLFDTPIAIISLVDEHRQWFKSRIGVDVTQTPRAISFCGHVILDDGLFEVSDALNDPRFVDNPMVTGEPYIRFYAACPLTSLDGQRIGAFCIKDTRPRTLSKSERQALWDLARITEREINVTELATRDELTGLSNRRGFMMMAEHALTLCASRDKSAMLAYLDLNSFKAINDELGHAEGDVALKLMAQAMQETFRVNDLTARLGGDEFVVMFPRSRPQAAEALLKRLRIRLHQLCQDKPYEIEFACGTVTWDPEQPTTLDQLLAQADRLMYQNKADMGAQEMVPSEPA